RNARSYFINFGIGCSCSVLNKHRAERANGSAAANTAVGYAATWLCSAQRCRVDPHRGNVIPNGSDFVLDHHEVSGTENQIGRDFRVRRRSAAGTVENTETEVGATVYRLCTNLGKRLSNR